MTRRTTLGLLLAVLAACGDDDNNGHLADAPQSDAPIVPQGVIVTVTLGGKPAKGQTVYFQNHDATATETKTTGDDGSATAIVEAGGYVTVIEPEAPLPALIGPIVHLSTFAAVKPGDHLYVDVPLSLDDAPAVSFNVTVPNEQHGYDYYLHSSCGSGYIGQGNGGGGSAAAGPVLTASITLRGCGGTGDLLVIGRGEGGVASWAYKPAVALTADASVVFDTLTATTGLDFVYRMPPSAVTGVEINHDLRSARGALFGDATFAGLDEGGNYSARIASATPADVLAITTGATDPIDGFSRLTVVTWGASTASTDVDFSAVGLNPYTNVPRFDPAQHAITWTAGAAGAAPDFTVGVTQGQRPDGEASHTWTWRVVAPFTAGETKLVYPTLPTTEFDFAFKDGDRPVVDSLTTVKLSEGGYDAARARVFSGSLQGLAAGATGRLVAEDMFFAPNDSLTARTGFERKKPATLRRGRFTRPAR